MTAATSDAATRSGPTNQPVELSRYTVSAGERVIYGQRVRGVVRLVDVPAGAAVALPDRA